NRNSDDSGADRGTNRSEPCRSYRAEAGSRSRISKLHAARRAAHAGGDQAGRALPLEGYLARGTSAGGGGATTTGRGGERAAGKPGFPRQDADAGREDSPLDRDGVHSGLDTEASALPRAGL